MCTLEINVRICLKQSSFLSNLSPPGVLGQGGHVTPFWNWDNEAKKMLGAEFWFSAHDLRKRCWKVGLAEGGNQNFGISIFLIKGTAAKIRHRPPLCPTPVYITCTQRNTQGPWAPRNLTRGPISVLKISVVVSPKRRLMRQYILCLKLWFKAWFKIQNFDPKVLRWKISRRGCRRSSSGVHRIEKLHESKS